MKGKTSIAGLVILLASVGCGGSGASPNPAPLLSIAGDYVIQKTTFSDGCEGRMDVLSNPGSVRHTPGASTFVLDDHGTRDLPGTVDPTGAFALQPFEGQAGGVPGRDTFENGRFTTSGFAVRVTTVVLRSRDTPPAPDCTVVMQWSGAKQGAPNVIP